MPHRSRTVLMSALLCGALTLASAAGARQQPPWQDPPRPKPPSKDAPRPKDFGSSLKRLKWDKKKKAAVEKEDAKRKGGGEADEEVVRVETSLVVSSVLVLDRQGRAVTGLTREDFVVAEDGKPQEVSIFALGDSAKTPRSIVLIIDYSGSQLPYLKTSVEAAKVLVEQLAPGDRLAVVTDDVKLLVGFTEDKQLLREKLDSLKALGRDPDAIRGWGAGHSLQYSALMAVLREMFDEEDVRPVVIFQTDGDELTILRRPDGERWQRLPLTQEFGLEDVYLAAERARATIYSVIPGYRLIGLPEKEQLRRARADLETRAATVQALAAESRTPAPAFMRPPSLQDSTLRLHAEGLLTQQKALSELAKRTGGWTAFLEEPSQAAGTYSLIASDISQRYVVGYYPTNKARDGARRTVTIEVRGHPEYVLLGPKAYHAPKE